MFSLLYIGPVLTILPVDTNPSVLITGWLETYPSFLITWFVDIIPSFLIIGWVDTTHWFEITWFVNPSVLMTGLVDTYPSVLIGWVDTNPSDLTTLEVRTGTGLWEWTTDGLMIVSPYCCGAILVTVLVWMGTWFELIMTLGASVYELLICSSTLMGWLIVVVFAMTSCLIKLSTLECDLKLGVQVSVDFKVPSWRDSVL